MSRVDRDDCFICGGGDRALLERHHIVPVRYGGSDEPPNVVEVCPTCHSAIEKLYNARFYEELGATTPRKPPGGRCDIGKCTAEAEVTVGGWGSYEVSVCIEHETCGAYDCRRNGLAVRPVAGRHPLLFCRQHRTCSIRTCQNQHTIVFPLIRGKSRGKLRALCVSHAALEEWDHWMYPDDYSRYVDVYSNGDASLIEPGENWEIPAVQND